MIQFVCGGGPCHDILYLIWYSLSVVVDRVMIYSILYDTVCLWWWTVSWYTLSYMIQFVCGGGPCHGILYLIWYSLSVVADRVMIYSINLIMITWKFTEIWHQLSTRLYDKRNDFKIAHTLTVINQPFSWSLYSTYFTLQFVFRMFTMSLSSEFKPVK